VSVATALLSALMVLIGATMIFVTFSNGGGPLSFGLLVGVMFIAAGAGRLWTLRRP
jgi:hypothetical protein